MNALVPIDSTKHVDSEFIYCEAMLADSMCIEGGSSWIFPPPPNCAIGRASLVFILRDVTRFTPLLACLVQ